jgi:Mg/Co/Ni transporter MgtE
MNIESLPGQAEAHRDTFPATGRIIDVLAILISAAVAAVVLALWVGVVAPTVAIKLVAAPAVAAGILSAIAFIFHREK